MITLYFMIFVLVLIAILIPSIMFFLLDNFNTLFSNVLVVGLLVISISGIVIVTKYLLEQETLIQEQKQEILFYESRQK